MALIFFKHRKISHINKQRLDSTSCTNVSFRWQTATLGLKGYWSRHNSNNVCLVFQSGWEFDSTSLKVPETIFILICRTKNAKLKMNEIFLSIMDMLNINSKHNNHMLIFSGNFLSQPSIVYEICQFKITARTSNAYLGA